jgi:predicted nuclease of predicted toxin-antitoxin system
MVRFLIDESTGKKLGYLLIDARHDVVFVSDWKPGATDSEVIKKAYEDNRIIITDDKDFGELIFRLKMKSNGVILIRTYATDPDFRFKLLSKLLKAIDVRNKFIVIRNEAVKIAKKW